jgi:hypothetical protein
MHCVFGVNTLVKYQPLLRRCHRSTPTLAHNQITVIRRACNAASNTQRLGQTTHTAITLATAAPLPKKQHQNLYKNQQHCPLHQ